MDQMTGATFDAAVLRRDFPALRLLLLHGSRARGDERSDSDFDLAYLGDEGLDELELRLFLARALRSESIDIVDLSRASGLLRFRAAKDGVLLYERRAGAFEDFVLASARFWFDVEPVLKGAYRAVLQGLG
jgi:predicted nucleotidyltransferase